LLLLVAAIAAFCVYHANWIHQRHAFLAQHSSDASRFASTFDISDEDWPSNPNSLWVIDNPRGLWLYSVTIDRKTSKHASNLLWLFGEPSHEQVNLVFRSPSKPPGFWIFRTADKDWALQSVPTKETDLAERLFPEAVIRNVVYAPSDSVDPDPLPQSEVCYTDPCLPRGRTTDMPLEGLIKLCAWATVVLAFGFLIIHVSTKRFPKARRAGFIIFAAAVAIVFAWGLGKVASWW
jgi:hypothetical protein